MMATLTSLCNRVLTLTSAALCVAFKCTTDAAELRWNGNLSWSVTFQRLHVVSSAREPLIIFFLVCTTRKVPISWNKRDTVVWVGFGLLYRSHQLGISQRRAEWFIKCTRDVAEMAFFSMSSSEGDLGEIMFVPSALEYEWLFFGPLYRFLMIHPVS